MTERERFQPRHFARDTVVASLAFAYSIWAIAGSGQDVIAKGFVLLLAGIPVYVGMRWWQQRDAGRTAAGLPPLSESNGKAPSDGERRVPVGAAAGPEGIGHDA